MSVIEALGLAVLHRFDPERAHGLSLKALAAGLVPLPGVVTSDRLRTTVAGLKLPNPVGLAAGVDKNATVVGPFSRAGFGFNNEGAEVIGARLSTRVRGVVPVGLNLGANKDSSDKALDFAKVLAVCGPHVDFATVNVSSPNTERLRDLQGRAALSALLAGVMQTRAELAQPIPVFLKIAPDLTDDELAEIAEVALASGVAGIIATNTTLTREDLVSVEKAQMGGLSGAPLFEKSTRVLAQLSVLTEGKLPLIGVGGIASAEEAFVKILVGASAVQFYTAMVYQGISLAAKIARGLDVLLEREGYASVADAVGKGRAQWL